MGYAKMATAADCNLLEGDLVTPALSLQVFLDKRQRVGKPKRLVRMYLQGKRSRLPPFCLGRQERLPYNLFLRAGILDSR